MDSLFADIGPAMQDRAGGYTRILKLGKRMSDSAEMAILEWVNFVPQPPKKKPAKDAKAGAKPEADEKEAKASK